MLHLRPIPPDLIGVTGLLSMRPIVSAQTQREEEEGGGGGGARGGQNGPS